MNRILLLLFLPLFFLFSDNQAKLVYIKQENLSQIDTNQTYVGQVVAIKYNILVLDNASISSIGFVDSPKSNVTLKNPNSSWNELVDGTLENVFYFKINNSKFFIPRLEVIVKNGDVVERELSGVMEGVAISLKNNHPQYSGVAAFDLKLDNYSIKFYDQKNNIVMLNLIAEYANLEDFKIPFATEQGFENKSFGITSSYGIYYAIIPNNLLNIEFEYFNLKSQSYNTISIKNIINKDQISINKDINPVNKELIFQNLTIIILVLLFASLFFVKKIPFKLRILSVVIVVILLLYLVFLFNFKREMTIISNGYITILPTHNSTIIEQVMANTRVEIVNSHSDYYKIITNDGKTGWIHKSNLKHTANK